MIRYRFEFPGRAPLVFEIDENGDSSLLKPGDVVPHWARLEVHRCAHCTLPPGPQSCCPAAVSLIPVLAAFADDFSHVEVLVGVEILGKEQRLQTSLQSALRSAAGLLMALSACPVMRKLRPMAHFHLPFGNHENTVFRAMGMYLLAQHMREKAGLRPDWGMDGLVGLYRTIHVTNERMAERLRIAAEKDATVNALINLDVFTFSFDLLLQKKLRDWKPLFAAYLEDDSA